MGEQMDVQRPRVNKREQNRIKEGLSYKDQLMMPEFLSEIPPDFADKWIAMPFPQGQRCLLISAKGRTLLIRRNGTEIAHFPCRLPGGSQKTNVRESMFTLFDCIFVEQALTIYVIDVLAWKGDVYYDYNTEFRMSWRDWKLSETEDLTVLDQNNIYKLVALPYYACSVSGLQSAGTHELPFAREGYLFYHLEATYEFGLTPAMGVIHSHILEKLVQCLQGTRPRENWFEDAQESPVK
jgi:snurportin-1